MARKLTGNKLAAVNSRRGFDPNYHRCIMLTSSKLNGAYELLKCLRVLLQAFVASCQVLSQGRGCKGGNGASAFVIWVTQSSGM